MIIHCTTEQQIEDVIKTENINMYTSPEKIFKQYGTNSCIENSFYGGLDFYKSSGYPITPYSDWKLMKQIQDRRSYIQLPHIYVQIGHGGYYAIIRRESDEIKIWDGWNISDEDLFNKIKYYEEMEKMNEKYIKDQFVQLGEGKLNITKAKKLGLWIEDKKVFTIKKDCRIVYGEYIVESYGTIIGNRILKIWHEGVSVIEVTNPTPEKVHHEFDYYGIEVEVE